MDCTALVIQELNAIYWADLREGSVPEDLVFAVSVSYV
jgi:hypothetical protein